jgi:hypothetical protein
LTDKVQVAQYSGQKFQLLQCVNLIGYRGFSYNGSISVNEKDFLFDYFWHDLQFFTVQK